jgi:hypothetical protein
MVFEPHHHYIFGVRVVDLVRAIGIVGAAIVVVMSAFDRIKAKREKNMRP